MLLSPAKAHLPEPPLLSSPSSSQSSVYDSMPMGLYSLGLIFLLYFFVYLLISLVRTKSNWSHKRKRSSRINRLSQNVVINVVNCLTQLSCTLHQLLLANVLSLNILSLLLWILRVIYSTDEKKLLLNRVRFFITVYGKLFRTLILWSLFFLGA